MNCDTFLVQGKEAVSKYKYPTFPSHHVKSFFTPALPPEHVKTLCMKVTYIFVNASDLVTDVLQNHTIFDYKTKNVKDKDFFERFLKIWHTRGHPIEGLYSQVRKFCSVIKILDREEDVTLQSCMFSSLAHYTNTCELFKGWFMNFYLKKTLNYSYKIKECNSCRMHDCNIASARSFFGSFLFLIIYLFY